MTEILFGLFLLGLGLLLGVGMWLGFKAADWLAAQAEKLVTRALDVRGDQAEK